MRSLKTGSSTSRDEVDCVHEGLDATLALRERNVKTACRCSQRFGVFQTALLTEWRDDV
jgi:hypothetical protein